MNVGLRGQSKVIIHVYCLILPPVVALRSLGRDPKDSVQMLLSKRVLLQKT